MTGGFRKVIPGEGAVCRFDFNNDPESVAAFVFGRGSKPGVKIVFTTRWFHSEEEASLWLDSEGIRNFVVPTGKLDLIALRSSGEIFDPVAGKPRKPRSSKRRGR